MLCEAGIQQVGSGRATLIVERSRTSVHLVSEFRLRTLQGPVVAHLESSTFSIIQQFKA